MESPTEVTSAMDQVKEVPVREPRRKKNKHDFVIPRSIFRRCIKDQLKNMHMTEEAANLLQSEGESHVIRYMSDVIRYMSDVARIAQNARRDTVLLCDTETVKAIYKNSRNEIPMN